MDTLTPLERSRRMALVRSKGNRSTELLVEAGLKGLGLPRWRKHPRNVRGKPDFYFPRLRLVLFVDGCFWHSCPVCGRLPKSRVEFWLTKIDANRRRDIRVRSRLRRDGFHVMRIWEHELKTERWRGRLLKLSNRIELAQKLHRN